MKLTKKSYEVKLEEVKLDVDAAGRKENPRAALKHVFAGLESPGNASDLLARYLYSFYALILMSEIGEAPANDVRKLVEIARLSLFGLAAPTEKGQFQHLYGNLHAVISQIARQQNNYQLSTWEQLTTMQYMQGATESQLNFQMHTLANRLLRSGHARKAIALYDQVLATELPESARLRCFISKSIALRCSGNIEGAKNWLTELEESAENIDEISLERIWEHQCIETQTNPTHAEALIALVRKGKSHHHASYFMESVLWGLAVPHLDVAKKVPSLTRMRKKSNLRSGDYGPYYSIVESIQNFYDEEIPLYVRLDQIGRAIAMATELLNVDRELLVYAAAARALFRLNMPEHGNLCLSRYQSLSAMLTDYSAKDSLTFMGDLL